MKIIKVFLVIFSILIIFYLLLIGPPGSFLLRKILQLQLTRLTHGLVTIESVHTNLFTDVELNQVVLNPMSNKKQPLLAFDHLKIQFVPWALLNKKIALKNIQLDDLQITIRRDSVGQYNFSENLFRSQDEAIPVASKPSDGFRIEIGSVRVANMSFDYWDHKDSVRAKLDEINLSIEPAPSIPGYQGRLNIENGQLNWRNWSQRLNQFQAKFHFDHDQFGLAKLFVRTDALTLESAGNYDLNSRAILAGKVHAQINIDILNQFFSLKNNVPYEGTLTLQGAIEGTLDQPSGKIKLSLDRAIVHAIPISHFTADLRLESRTIQLADLAIDSPTGNVRAVGELNYRQDSLAYQCKLALRNCHLAELLKKFSSPRSDQLKGILDGDFSFVGSKPDWRHLIANGELNFSRLTLESQRAADIHANLSVANGRLKFNLVQAGSQLNLVGSIAADHSISGQFDGNLSDIETLASLADLPGLSGQLRLAGDVNGTLESPSVHLNFDFGEGSYRGIPITKVQGGITFQNDQLIFSRLAGYGETNQLQAIARSFSIDSLAGSLSYRFSADGNLNQIQAAAEISWSKPQLNRLNFDAMNLSLRAIGKDLFIDTLRIRKENSALSAQGQGNFENDLFFYLRIKAEEFDNTLRSISNSGSFRLTGKLKQDGRFAARLVGDEVNLAPLAKLFSIEEPLKGHLSFQADIRGRADRPAFDLSWQLDNPGYRHVSWDSAAGQLHYDNASLTISQITATQKDGTFRLEGELPIDLYALQFSRAKNSLIRIQAHQFDLNLIDALLSDSTEVGGKLSAQLEFQGDWQAPQLNGELQIDQAVLATPYLALIDSISLTSHFAGQEIRLERLAGKIKEFYFDISGKGHFENRETFDVSLNGDLSQIGQVQFQANRQPDQALTGQLKIVALDLNHLIQVVPVELQIAGRVDGVVNLTNDGASPVVSMKINSNRIQIEKAALDSLHLTAMYNKHLINIDDSGFKIGDGWIAFNGSLPFDVSTRDSVSLSIPEIRFESYAQDLNIEWLRPLLSGVTKLEGNVDYGLTIAGSMDQPDVYGFFNLKNGAIKLKDLNPEMTNIAGRINLAGDKVKVDSLGGLLGKGSFKVRGQTRVSQRQFWDTEFKLSLDNIAVASPDIFSLNVEKGELMLKQAADDFKLNGKIQLREAKYIQDYRPRISQFLRQIPNRPQPEAADVLNRLQLDVIIQGQENVWIENNLARLQMTSNLNVLGTLAEPRLSGRIVVNKGYVLYLDRRFKITTGSIDFTDPHRINPYVDIAAVTNVTDYQATKEISYTITLKLTGLLEKLDFALVAEPALDQANIVAMLTLGRTRENLFPTSGTTPGSSFQQIMLDRFKEITSQRLAGMTEQQLSRSLALENISIEGNLFQLDKSWGPRVTATKKLSDRINLTYSTVVGHATEQQIKLGYQLAKNLSIVGSTGQTGQSGLDLKFHFKFY